MRNFEISADLPRPGETWLLEASAGTGKTWTIAALVARYVAEGVCALPEMLVVTFTRAASQELRQRVRQRLRQVERVLADPAARPEEPDELLDVLLGHADQTERERMRERVGAALAEFDAATIVTIHQFCQTVLKGLGVAGDTDAHATLVEDLDDLLVEVVDDLYLRDYAHDDGGGDLTRKLALALARQAVADPRTRLEPADAEPDSAAGRRVRFCDQVRTELDIRKRRLGVLSYDDLLGQLADALADDDAPARQRMRDRWRVVLIDEFQDTDPVQWEVFRRAFTGHAAMVLIGDPKQAVYAFRGGDVFTYLQAKHSARRTCTLGTNRRSDQVLLDSMQVVLEGAALGSTEIVVHPVRASHEGSRLAGRQLPPFRVRAVERADLGLGDDALVPVGRANALIARDVASEVKRLLTGDVTFDGDPLRPRQIAVLAHLRRHLHLVRDALLKVGVPAVVAGGDSVFRSPAATEWLTLLEALDQPHSSRRVRAAALTPFFGRTADDLASRGDATTEEVGDVLRDWVTLFSQRGIAAVFETAVARHDLVARVLGTVGGERLLTDLQHLAQLLHRVAVEQRLGLVALLAWLHEQASEEIEEVASERTRKLDSDQEAVQLVTLHGSKGLEYPVVLLPFVADRWAGKAPEVLLHHDDAGERVLDVGGAADAATRRRAADEDLAESLRTLYVAMTRAQSQLTAWWAPTWNTTTAPLHRMLCGRRRGESEPRRSLKAPSDPWVHARLDEWQQQGGPVWSAADPGLVDVATLPVLTDPLRQRSFSRRVDTAWRRTSYTALSSPRAGPGGLTIAAMVGSEPEYGPKADEPELPEPENDEPASTAGVPSPLADFPAGAQFGSLLHAVLEHADPAATEHGGDLAAELREVITEQLVRWPVAVDPAALADAMVEVYDSPLGPLAGGCTLRSLGVVDRMCELDFELPLGGGDRPGRGQDTGALLRDVAPLLRRHLPADDPVRAWADSLDRPELGDQELRGYLAGSVDVVMRVAGPEGPRFLVVDYKSNRLGHVDSPLTSVDYDRAALAAAMGHSSYPLQALLYAVVLHRFLRWRLPGYDPARHFGGVLYLYLRGMCGVETPVVDGHPSGVFSWQPPVALVEELSALLDGPAAGEAAS